LKESPSQKFPAGAPAIFGKRPPSQSGKQVIQYLFGYQDKPGCIVPVVKMPAVSAPVYLMVKTLKPASTTRDFIVKQ
jgi:hypothetical protein